MAVVAAYFWQKSVVWIIGSLCQKCEKVEKQTSAQRLTDLNTPDAILQLDGKFARDAASFLSK